MPPSVTIICFRLNTLLTLGERCYFTIQIVHRVPNFGPILLYWENKYYMPEATRKSDAYAAFAHTLKLRHSF